MKWFDKLTGKNRPSTSSSRRTVVDSGEPSTPAQARYLGMMLRELEDGSMLANKPTDAVLNADTLMLNLLKRNYSAAELDDYYNVDWSRLSKAQASKVLDIMVPAFDDVREDLGMPPPRERPTE